MEDVSVFDVGEKKEKSKENRSNLVETENQIHIEIYKNIAIKIISSLLNSFISKLTELLKNTF